MMFAPGAPTTRYVRFVALEYVLQDHDQTPHGRRTSSKKPRVVVFGGHPDDPESGAGGLIALLTRAGHEVICSYATCFRGERKFFDRPEAEVRREEAAAACRVLGATPNFFPYAHEKLMAAWKDFPGHPRSGKTPRRYL